MIVLFFDFFNIFSISNANPLFSPLLLNNVLLQIMSMDVLYVSIRALCCNPSGIRGGGGGGCHSGGGGSGGCDCCRCISGVENKLLYQYCIGRSCVEGGVDRCSIVDCCHRC